MLHKFGQFYIELLFQFLQRLLHNKVLALRLPRGYCPQLRRAYTPTIVPLAPLQHPVAPVPGGVPVGAAADLPCLVIGPAVTLGVLGTWSSSFYWSAGTALLV